MGKERRRRAVLSALLAIVAACGQESLSDSELVWCKANLAAVAASATSLGLPSPSDLASWSEWARLAIAAELAA